MTVNTLNLEENSEVLRNLIRDTLAEVLRERKPPKRAPALKTGEQRILNSLSWLEKTTHKSAFPAPIVAYFSHVTNAGVYSNHRKSLRSQQMIENTYGGFMKLTEAGRNLSHAEMTLDNPVETQATA
jgi:hypothetical protein